MALNPVPFTIYRQRSAPEPPETLGIHGTKLWRDILTEHDIADAARLVILEQAAFALDRAESLRRLIAVEGELIVTDRGGTKANPLVMCELQARGLVVRLIDRLKLSGDEPKRGRPPNQRPSF